MVVLGKQPQRKTSSQRRTRIAWRTNRRREFPLQLENGIACQFQRGAPGLWNQALFSVACALGGSKHMQATEIAEITEKNGSNPN
jgi:hypothetical protein